MTNNKEQVLSHNLKAFLDMIAHSEGTSTIKRSDNGYNVIVGGDLFFDYKDHPRKLVRLRPGLSSTAAGRYQLLARYFDIYKKQIGLKDFSPTSQDAIAIQQIKERGALKEIEAGYLAIAILKVRNIWASLPGAGYGQHEDAFSTLAQAYQTAGGTLV